MVRPPAPSAPAVRHRAGALGLLVAVALGVFTPVAAWGRDASIGVVDNAFSPQQATIEVGETITFSWLGQNRHSVNGPWPDPHPGCTTTAQVTCAQQGDTPFVFEATEVGSFAFQCPVHPEMTGSFEVVPASEPSPTPSPAPTPPSSSGPSEQPDPRFTVGPPPPRATEPAVVVEGTAEPVARPTELHTLEPFPAAVDPDVAVASESAQERDVAIDQARAEARANAPRVVAFALLLGTVVAFVQFILLGPAWVTGPHPPDGPARRTRTTDPHH